MTPERLLLTDKTADTLIDALKKAAMVNISWGGELNMLCGNPLADELVILDISCGNEDQAWAINRAKGALSQGDEQAARSHIAPLIRKPLN